MGSAGPTRLILDTDPSAGFPGVGVDDVLALAFALGAGARVEAVTVVAGHVELAEAWASARAALRALGRPEVPVAPGAAGPLVGDRAAVRAALRARRRDSLARRLWRGVPRPVLGTVPAGPRAAEVIVRTALGAPGRVTLVALGPLTNVAIALLWEPGLARALRGVVFMGGHLGRGRPPAAPVEFNVGADPEAAAVVLRSGAKLTMVGYDVTTRVCLDPGALEAATRAPTAAARFLRRVTVPWIRYSQVRRGLPGCWLHDPLAVAAALDPTLLRTEPLVVSVELRGEETRGLTLARPPGGQAGVTGGLVDVAVDVDEGRFLAWFLEALGRAAAGCGRRRPASLPG